MKTKCFPPFLPIFPLKIQLFFSFFYPKQFYLCQEIFGCCLVLIFYFLFFCSIPRSAKLKIVHSWQSCTFRMTNFKTLVLFTSKKALWRKILIHVSRVWIKLRLSLGKHKTHLKLRFEFCLDCLRKKKKSKMMYSILWPKQRTPDKFFTITNYFSF